MIIAAYFAYSHASGNSSTGAALVRGRHASRVMRCLSLAVLALSLSLTAVAANAGSHLRANNVPEADRAAKFVVSFYTAHLPRTGPGLPLEDDLSVLRPWITPHLYALFVDALKFRHDLAKRFGPEHRDDKPPCVEGPDYFVGGLDEWPDHVQWNVPQETHPHFEVQSTKRAASRWHVRTRFWYDTTPRIQWETVLVLERRAKRFRIADVVELGSPTPLSSVLLDCAKGQGW